MYTTNDILKIFQMSNTQKSSILSAEKKLEIPLAEKIARGSIKVRQWKSEDLPVIGKKFGYLKSPGGQKIISVYVCRMNTISVVAIFSTLVSQCRSFMLLSAEV